MMAILMIEGKKESNMAHHKSRFWRDIDKHPLPSELCNIDVKLSCGSELMNCINLHNEHPFPPQVFFIGADVTNRITQWRDAK